MSERVQQESRGIQFLPHDLSADLHLWWVDLDACADAVPIAGLETSDYAQADRMKVGQDARRLRASRHVLRWLIAETLGRSPGQLVIEADALGKPHLADGAVQFNVSHSGRYGLVGISRDREVGVDVEVIRPVPEVQALARDHFTEFEHAEWCRAGPAQRDRRFLECWTRKEACAKALGTGLLIPPRLIEVGCAAEVRSVSVPIGEPPCEVTVCSLQLSFEAVAAAAVATEEAAEAARQAASPP